MTIAEMIAEQRRACEAAKAAKLRPKQPSAPAPVMPKKPTQAEAERAYREDRTYDGKAPEGSVGAIMRKENPNEYIGRDGTRTFVPWRYVSMRDIELPDVNNPYRRNEETEQSETDKFASTHIASSDYDPWSRPSGYMDDQPANSQPQSTPTQMAVNPEPTPGPNASWDDWLAPVDSPTNNSVMNEKELATFDIMRGLHK